MPIQNYGVLKGRIFTRQRATAHSEHFQILVNLGNKPHRIAINTKSSEPPSQVLYYASINFHHAITDAIIQANLPDGYSAIVSKPGGIALDFIRQNLFDPKDMVALPSQSPGDNDDLNDKLDFFVQMAIADPSATVYAFGQHWTDDNKADQYFPEINPSTGIHDIHMNQGNKSGAYFKDNGIYQDGGLIFHYASRNTWSAVFTAFQSQAFHTDDTTGNPLTVGPGELPSVRLVAAMVNPGGDDFGKEYVILLNKGNKPVDLSGWQIADKLKQKDTIGAVIIPAGDTKKIMLAGNGAQLGNKGGNITLLNKAGVKVDGATYTKADAVKEGELVEL